MGSEQDFIDTFTSIQTIFYGEGFKLAFPFKNIDQFSILHIATSTFSRILSSDGIRKGYDCYGYEYVDKLVTVYDR